MQCNCSLLLEIGRNIIEMVILKGMTLIFDKYDELKQFAASIKNKLKLNAVNSTFSKYLLITKKDSHEP